MDSDAPDTPNRPYPIKKTDRLEDNPVIDFAQRTEVRRRADPLDLIEPGLTEASKLKAQLWLTRVRGLFLFSILRPLFICA
jgi:hypothetical protein